MINENEILKLYGNFNSIREIKRKTGLSFNNIRNILIKNNVKIKSVSELLKDKILAHKKEIIDLYLSGKNLVEVGNITGISSKRISFLLKDLKILRHSKERIYDVNDDYFSNIDHEHKAY